MTSLPPEPASDSGTPAPQRKRVWWKRWKLWLPLGFVVFVLNSCTPDYDYVWFEADVTVDGETLTVTQMIECGYRGSSFWPIDVYSPSKTNAAVGAQLKGGAGLMIWHFGACGAAIADNKRKPVTYIAGINWLDDIKKPVRMEFYPTLTSLQADGSRVRLNDVRFRKGPASIFHALLYPAYWREHVFGITSTIPYLSRTRQEIHDGRFIGLIACITPEDKWRQYETVANALEAFTEPKKGSVFRDMEKALGWELKSGRFPGKFVDMVAFHPGEFLDDCARGLPHVPGEGWILYRDPAVLPLFIPAHEASYDERILKGSGNPEFIETRRDGFLIKGYGDYSFYLPDSKLFIYVTPFGQLDGYRNTTLGP